MAKLTREQAKEIIGYLQAGQDVPDDYRHILFPPERREYELVYAGKEREEDVVQKTWGVPLQAVKTFGVPKEQAIPAWTNRLIFGDNLQVMKRLLEDPDVREKVNLVYIDPPFATKQDFRGSQDQKAYQDKVAGGHFIEFIRRRLILIRELLSPDGCVYVHLDQRKGHYIKVVMDEVFGEMNFMNEIAWCYSERELATRHWNRKHDIIFVYAKNLSRDDHVFNWREASLQYSKGTVGKFKLVDEDGRKYQLRGRNLKESPYAGKHGIPAEVEHSHPDWVYRDYLDVKEGIRPRDWWDDIPFLNRASSERFDYPSSKPPDLLERIIRVSSNEGDLVLDAFAGSGTTCTVAEKLGRRWIGIDCGKLAIYTVQKRMLSLRKGVESGGKSFGAKPFTLYNAGLYDFARMKELPWEDYRRFALQLFQVRDQPHTVSGIKMDGFKGTADVLIFNFKERDGVQVDEGYIASLHEHMGSQARDEFFLIAPAARVTFLEDYIDRGNARYYVLRIPYSIIDELHDRPFQEIRQPADETEINNTVEAVGFDFVVPPKVKATYTNDTGNELFAQAVIHIKEFRSEAMTRKPRVFANRETLSMVMVDFDYKGNGEGVFDLDAVFYRDQIEAAGWKVAIEPNALGPKCMIIYMDIFGNELREVKTPSDFGIEPLKVREESVPYAKASSKKRTASPPPKKAIAPTTKRLTLSRGR